MGSFVFVENMDEIKKNVISFNAELKKADPDFLKYLTQYKHWYYFDDLDMFGPSKYIGYKNMNADLYVEKDNISYQNNEEYTDGRKTEKVLKELKIFEVSDEGTLFEKLNELLNSYDKHLRKNAVIKRIIPSMVSH